MREYSHLVYSGLGCGSSESSTNARKCVAHGKNSKVERFFGTLKEKLKHYTIPAQQLATDLALFRLWYNHTRPHQHLNGKTPAEAWNRQQPNPSGKHFYFEAWDGALTGLYLPPS